MSAVSPFTVRPALTIQAGESWTGVLTVHNPSPFYYKSSYLGWSGSLPPGSVINYRGGEVNIPAYSDWLLLLGNDVTPGVTIPADAEPGSYIIRFIFPIEETDMPGLPLGIEWTADLPVTVTAAEGEIPTPPAEFVPPYNIPLDVWNQLTPEHQAAILAAAAGQPVPIPEPTGELPWYMNIQTSITDFLTNSYNTLTNSIGGLTGMLGVVSSAIAAGFAGLWSGLLEHVQSLVASYWSESIKSSVTGLRDAVSHSTPEKAEVQRVLDNIADAQKTLHEAAMSAAAVAQAAYDPEARAIELNQNATVVASATIAAMEVGTLAEFLTLGQVEGVTHQMLQYANMWGHNDLVRQSALIPWTWLFFKPANQYYASKYTPEIPPYSDLVNMRVKEKITPEEFETYLKFQGYSPYWAGKIWDAHFYAPTLTDILTAWRRGLIDESRVDELMILVDLDPFYKQVFDTRKYIDPPVTMARWMFETGAITEERVREIVHRAGYNEVDAESVVNFITRFQERRFRARLMTALMTGITYGAYSDEDLRAAVRETGYTDAVADIMLRIAEVRRRTEEARITRPKPRLLSVGELKRGYMHNVVTEDALRTELMNRGYELGQVDALVNVMEADKVVTDAGGKKVALTVAEMKAAYQYGTITEDYLRQTLLLRGLDLSEVDILINTWKKQWDVGG